MSQTKAEKAAAAAAQKAEKAAAAAAQKAEKARLAVSAALTKLGIEHDKAASTETLQSILEANSLPKDPRVPKAGAIPAADSHGFDVKDPVAIVNQELPLIVTPGKGKEWKNPAAAEYAGIINASAYARPHKWEDRKPRLLAQLAELNDLPAREAAQKLHVIKGGAEGGLKFPNKHTTPPQQAAA